MLKSVSETLYAVSVAPKSAGVTKRFASEVGGFASTNLDNIIRFPGLIKEGFQRTVQTNVSEPALAGNGLDPVLFLPCRRAGAEIDIARSIIVLFRFIKAVDTWLGLIGL
jgi:hypothetical protein